MPPSEQRIDGPHFQMQAIVGLGANGYDGVEASRGFANHLRKLCNATVTGYFFGVHEASVLEKGNDRCIHVDTSHT